MSAKGKSKDQLETISSTIDELAKKGIQALEAYADYDQDQIDKIVHAMALAGVDQHMQLAKFAVEETGRGIYEDKCIKNIFVTEYIWNSIKNDKTVGIISDDRQNGIIEIAQPVGVIAGVTPVTNPTSTTMFKALIATKTRNPIIFAFHPSAQKCSQEAAKLLYEAAVAAGAPEHCIQWIEQPSLEATNLLINHPQVALSLATGGSAMVKAAYSTGKPAVGVGPGNVPVFIEKTAKVARSVTDIVLSKSFDHGMICASEQCVIVEKPVAAAVKAEFERNNCYFVTDKEKQTLAEYMLTETGGVKPQLVGSGAEKIAQGAGIKVPNGTKILLVKIDGAGPDHPFSHEKLCPVLAYKEVKTAEEGISFAEKIVEYDGLGHSAVIHSRDTALQYEFGKRVKVCRIMCNSPSSMGGIGDIYNSLLPSLTLGCGSYGHNSVSNNVSAVDLINVKRIAERRNNMQWFKVPPRTYFERYSIRYLRTMQNISRVAIVADPGMVEFKYVDIVIDQLRKHDNEIEWTVFADVEPNPTSTTVFKGAAMMKDFKPDCIVALGGGSAMDAAKGMWLFYEQPESSYFGMKQKFLDIRKRTYTFPTLGEKAKFVAIPTTSGTGSECTPFTVITDAETHVKYPLADYAVLPDVAIVDAQFVDTVPARTAADSGMDALTHSIESYISIMASDYTRGLSIRAAQLIFANLRKSVNDRDPDAKEHMHNASAMAGMAFANAFLGIVHSLSHKCGGEFGLAHGRTNAIFLPLVLRYNSSQPSKLAMFPKYENFRADQDLADFARAMGFPASTVEEGVASLIREVTQLANDLGIDLSFKANGVSKELLESKAERLAELAFEDQCTTANPRMPLMHELKEIILDAYEGVDKNGVALRKKS